MVTNDEILEIGRSYGLTNDIIGYPDFERVLLCFATAVYVRGFNAGVFSEILANSECGAHT